MKPVLAIAALALCAVLATLRSPGLTIDESLNVRPGVVLVRAERSYGLGVLDPSAQREIFTVAGLPTDYPPLGRFLLGIGHEVAGAFVRPKVVGSPGDIDVVLARTSSAVAFGLTIALVGFFARRWYGDVAAVAAALAVAVNARLFGHAHQASIETVLNLVFTACVLLSADRLSRPALPRDEAAASDDASTPPTLRREAAVCGLLWGLVLLTKIQAVLIPLPLAGWLLWHRRTRAIEPLAIFGGVGLLTFLVGWPWLWDAPIDRMLAYFGQGTDRIVLHAYAFGTTYDDRDVPLAYVPTMFALTTPLAALLLGGRGLWLSRRHAPSQLVTATMGFVLVFFMVPAIVVYDGVRLFLVAFPLWAVLVGAGAADVWHRLAARRRLRLWLAIAAVALPTLRLLTLFPCWLAGYTIGTGPALAVGMEGSYWGDAVTPSLLAAADRDERDQVVLLTPTLHVAQLTEQAAHAGYELAEFTPERNADGRFRDLIVFSRWADLEADGIPARLLAATPGETIDGWTVTHVVRREGGTLAVLAQRGARTTQDVRRDPNR